MLDRRSLVQAPNAPRDQSQHRRACNNYDEETAYDCHMNPEPGFHSGPGGSVVCRRRLNGTLPANYEIQSLLGGGLRIDTVSRVNAQEIKRKKA